MCHVKGSVTSCAWQLVLCIPTLFFFLICSYFFHCGRHVLCVANGVVYVHTHTHTRTHTHTHAHTRTHTHTHAHTYTHIYTHTLTHTHTHAHTHTHRHIHTYTHTYTHMYIHIHTYIYIHIYIWICMYIHTLSWRALYALCIYAYVNAGINVMVNAGTTLILVCSESCCVHRHFFDAPRVDGACGWVFSSATSRKWMNVIRALGESSCVHRHESMWLSAHRVLMCDTTRRLVDGHESMWLSAHRVLMCDTTRRLVDGHESMWLRTRYEWMWCLMCDTLSCLWVTRLVCNESCCVRRHKSMWLSARINVIIGTNQFIGTNQCDYRHEPMWLSARTNVIVGTNQCIGTNQCVYPIDSCRP